MGGDCVPGMLDQTIPTDSGGRVRDLTGRTAVITGAASGLGRAMAEQLAGEGMRLVLADIEPAPLEALADALGRDGADVVSQRADVARPEDVEGLADLAFDRSVPSTCCATTPAW